MATDDTFEYMNELIALYMRATSLLAGFRLPISDPFTIEGDNNGRATAIVLILGREGAIRMSDVAKRLHFSPSSATIIIDKMVRKGLVKRVSQENDRRIINIILDKEGQAAFKRLNSELVNSLDKILSPLSADERSRFIELFRKIARGLKKERLQ
ncbi:MAG: MarR family transcriptional regulator [Candidatus Lokiarchaeota archaeon]|nr:MarR family transcriptional regulator [Candidatus Lokiarchaeota archaeon]